MKFNRILAAVLSVICLSSCADFLTEAPTTALSEGTVYSDEANLEAGVIGVYWSLKTSNWSWTTQMGEFITYPSRLVVYKDIRKTEQYIQSTNLTLFPQSADNQGVYDYLYASIYKCNKMIEAMSISPVDQAYKNEIEGEVKFLRAWQYYAAVRFWGDIPLILNTPKNIDETDAPRTHYTKVYEQIIKDLEFAEENMRSPERVDQVGGMTGRPNKWAATAVKASVYMQIACLIEHKEYQFFDYQNNPERDCNFSALGINTAEDAWKLCLQTAEKVINEGPYELAPSFADLFDWGPEAVEVYKSKERIFVLQNTMEGAACYLQTRTLPNYWNGTTKNNNWGRFRPERFVLWKWGTIHGGVHLESTFGPNLFSTVKDPRYELSYIHSGYTNMSTGKNQTVWPKNCSHQSWHLPFFRKYADPSYDCSVGYSDLYLVRFAEMYLIAAEAAASLSAGSGDAYWQKAMDHMEVIHARARKSVAEGEPEAEFPRMSDWNCQTREELISAIMWERVFEMHGEIHEIFDTHRRGGKWMSEWLSKPLNAYLKMPEQLYPSQDKSYFFRTYHERFLPEDPQTLRKSVLFAFPEHEFRNNAAIDYEDQNDFYWSSLEN